MLNRGVIVAALAVYAAVLGVVLWPSDAPAERKIDVERPAVSSAASYADLPYRSVGIQIQRVDWIDKYKQSIDEIAELGADTVLLVVDARQENGGSSYIYLDMRMTPTPDQLGDLIRHAKSKNLRVMLMPIVLLDRPRKATEWRGTIAPDTSETAWEDWWDSYRSMMGHFAWIAEANDVDVLVVGSELVSTEDKLDQWTRTIDGIRQTFKGKLTYSSNWDHYTSVPFWDQLDLIGMNSYWKLGKNRDATVEEIQGNWKNIQKDLLAFQKKVGKPILFLEVGWCSLTNAAHEPWDYTKSSEQVDPELQKRLYEGFFTSWYGSPALGGFSIWEWPPGDGGPADRGYTPEKKPAEQVLREWLAKPRWEVK